jgi:Ca-activated chloride channel family protein
MYKLVVGRIDQVLQKFHGVNKALLQAALSGVGALLGSMLGFGVMTLVLVPSQSLILRIGLWDVFIGLGIGLSIAVVQSWHLGRLAVAGADLLKAGVLSALGGLLGGGALGAVKAGTGAVFGFGTTVPNILGSTVEGLVFGFFVAKAVPNLTGRAALLAGAAAGFSGGVLTAFYVPVAVGDVFKGIFLGLALGVAEQVGKKAWVTLRREVPESILASRSLVFLERPPMLLLGDRPLLVGSCRECDVFMDTGAQSPAMVATVALRDGVVIYDDLSAGRRRPLGHGDEVRLGDLTLKVGCKLVATPEAAEAS